MLVYVSLDRRVFRCRVYQSKNSFYIGLLNPEDGGSEATEQSFYTAQCNNAVDFGLSKICCECLKTYVYAVDAVPSV